MMITELVPISAEKKVVRSSRSHGNLLHLGDVLLVSAEIAGEMRKRYGFIWMMMAKEPERSLKSLTEV